MIHFTLRIFRATPVWTYAALFAIIVLGSLAAARMAVGQEADPVLANVPPPGSTLTAVGDVTTFSGVRLDQGARVEVVGVVPVSADVAESGYLLNFRYESQIYVADLANFLQPSPDTTYYLAGARSSDAGASAQVCAAIYSNQAGVRFDLDDADLAAFLEVRLDGLPLDTPQAHLDQASNARMRFCVKGLPYSTPVQILVKSGLIPGPSAPVLGHDLAVNLVSAAKTPSLKVDSGTFIVPLSEQGVLPVEVVNLSEFSVRLVRIDPRTIANINTIFTAQSPGQIDWLSRRYGQDLGTFSIPVSVPKDQATRLNVDLSLLGDLADPGLFVAMFEAEELDMSPSQKRPTLWFVRSRLGITTYAGLTQTHLHVRDFATAAGVAGATVQLIAQNNRELFSGQTSDQGAVVIETRRLRGQDANAPAYAFVTTEAGDFSVLEMRDFQAIPRVLAGGLAKPQGEDAYLTLARDLVRPGQSVHFYAALRRLNLDVLANFDLDLVLVDQRGADAAVQDLRTNAHGLIAGAFELGENAALGTYAVEVRRKDQTLLARAPFRVETFVPLTLEAKFGDLADPWDRQDALAVPVSAQYLSGGAAQALNATIEASLVHVRRIAGLPDFVFGPVDAEVADKVIPEKSLILDQDGAAKALISPFEAGPGGPGLQAVHLSLAVFDVGGRPNKAQSTVWVDTHGAYVGLRPAFDGRLDAGATPAFDLIVTDRAGQPLPPDAAIGDIEVRVSRLHYDYDWYYRDGWRWRGHMQVAEPVYTQTWAPGYRRLDQLLPWGSYRVTATLDQGFVTEFDFDVGWGGAGISAAEPTALNLFYDRPAGAQTGLLRLEAPFDGVLQVHLAGSDVIAERSFSVEAGPVELPLAVPGSLEPGLNILATLIRPVAGGTEHLPQLALGKTWVPNLDDQRHLAVAVHTPERLRSVEPIEVQMDLTRAASAQLFLIDEGIHAITGFENTDPADHFFGERALGLGFGSNLGRLIQQDRSLEAFRVGGDVLALMDMAIQERRQNLETDFFDTVVAVSPLLTLQAGRQSYVFDPARVEGRLRLVVLVADDQGTALKTDSIPIQDPVSLDVSLPRFVGVGDHIDTQVQVRANADADLDLSLSVGGQQSRLNWAMRAGDQRQHAVQLAPQKPGPLDVAADLSYDDLLVRRAFALAARTPSYPQYETQALPVSGGMRVPPVPFGTLDATQPHTLVSATLSPYAGAGFDQLVQSIRAYPYGCVEQTASGVRALVFQQHVLQDADETRLRRIQEGLDHLIDLQRSDGRFGYWSRYGGVMDVYQPYAVETLALALPFAKEPDAVLDALHLGMDALQRQSLRDSTRALQAQGVLAKAGRQVTSQARYLLDQEVLADDALARLDSASARLDRLSLGLWVADAIGDARRADAISKRLTEEIAAWQRATAGARHAVPDGTVWQTLEAGSRARILNDRAAAYLAQVRPQYQTTEIQSFVSTIAHDLSRQPYRSTLTNARLLQIFRHLRVPQDLTVTIDGRDQQVGADGKIDLSRTQVTQGFQLSTDQGWSGFLNVEALGMRSSIDPVTEGLRISKSLADRQGEILYEDRNLFLPEFQDSGARLTVTQGDTVTVVLNIDIGADANGGRSTQELMITDLLPSGFELETVEAQIPHALRDEGALRRVPMEVQHHDDRFTAHFSGYWRAGDRLQIAYVMRAAYAGRMIVPDAHVEYMYQPWIHGRSARGLGEVLAR